MMKRIVQTCRILLGIVVVLAAATTAVRCDGGNVFLVGESVRVPLPAAWQAWRAVDVDGREVAAGAPRDGAADLGTLPIGYYEVWNRNKPERITAAVVAKVAPADQTPIAVDAAMSWFYADPEQIREACHLCRLAGVRWVRDRLSWPELQPARGEWAAETRYEPAMRIQRDEGLKILQVNHASPPWATSTPSRFPEDLRDVYEFYRGLAERWKVLADAIEPWNEPDIELFGGHTGCEIASFHKAAALGLRAGNPDQPVSGTVFALDRAETLEEFGANEVYPYFDRYHLHHYIAMPNYPRAYGRHRAVSGGRPMWTTEFNLPVEYEDEKTKEPADEQLRVAGFRVGKVFATALNEGVEKAFYFILGDYVERGLQFGLVHQDLTPRPAYVAFAAVGRLLNGAKPIGRVDLGDEKLKGYVFRTKVDGVDRETLVAWSETHETPIDVPQAVKAYDYLGRELASGGKVRLTRETAYLLLPPGGSQQLKVEPAPETPPWKPGAASPVVLQLIGAADSAKSAFKLDSTRKLQLAAYNFGDAPARGKLSCTGARLDAADFEINPGERKLLPLAIDKPGKVKLQLELNGGGHAIVAARVIDAAAEPPAP